MLEIVACSEVLEWFVWNQQGPCTRSQFLCASGAAFSMSQPGFVRGICHPAPEQGAVPVFPLPGKAPGAHWDPGAWHSLVLPLGAKLALGGMGQACPSGQEQWM